MEFSSRMVLYMATMVLSMVLLGIGEGELHENFYAVSCPNVEFTVRQAVLKKLSQTFTTATSTLRLFFHDCIVEGCDASIMIASQNNTAEKDYSDNLSLPGDGFDTVIQAKQAVEAVCPGVVSCADIMAIAARDVIVLTGGPTFNVELGRRDGLVSQASRVPGNLPEPDFDLKLLNSIFNRHNLSQVDLVALSGAHTIGVSHCDSFAKRLYSSSGVDPSLDRDYAQQLMIVCPTDPDPSIVVIMDFNTPQVFDNAYYHNLVAGKGLFTSDQVLFTDPASKATVSDFASNQLNFYKAFATAMIKLGRVGVKTGTQGEIRRDCTSFN